MIETAAFLIGTTLMYSTPLIYTALGGVLSENGGVVNIGLEGMMYTGAFTGAAVGYLAGDPWLGFLAAGLAGMFLALLHAAACINFHADHVVSGIAVNFLGPGFSLFMCRILFNGATMTVPLNLDSKIPLPLNGFFSGGSGLFSRNSVLAVVFNQYATVYLALILAAAVWFFLYKTKPGLRVRSVGENPKAAASLGINVYRVKYLAVLSSGFFAGLGGAAMSIAVVSRFSPTLISGQGFIALAAMIFGKWRPQGALAACLLFGLAQGLVITLGKSGLNISSQLLAMIPYVLTLVILVGFVGRASAPAAVGLPYKKE
jgi:simple sugar transport system permease protein